MSVCAAALLAARPTLERRATAARDELLQALAAVAEGRDPLCVIRDPAKQNVDFGQRSLLMDQRQVEGNYAGGFGRAMAEVR